MMLPLRDLNPTRRTPFLTYILISLNILVFIWQQMFSLPDQQNIFLNLSVVPANIIANPFSLETLLDILRSMFFHGNWFHLFSN
ncbi:MAG: rhomboid family intramembrane serine protease, partial [Anaerolineales bacterium]|nr:rhomboid family intramembrane serine protease [Anaerolineales bacterium]